MTLLNDSIGTTLDQIGELLRGLPPESRHRAKTVAVQFESVVNNIRRGHPADPAAGLGLAFAVFKTAEQLIDADRNAAESGRGLIQLL